MSESQHPTVKDEADLAAEQEEHLRNEALWRVRRASRLQHRGHCYNCGADCKGLFCDVECRRDYEKRQSTAKRQQGEY